MNNIKNHVFPESEEELLELLKKPNVQILAGGTDLTINTDSKTETIIDLQKLNLRYFREVDETYVIGAMTTAYDIYTNVKLPQSLRDAAFKVSDMPLLHAVTIGGNVAKLYPWCDLPPMLWALEATFKVIESSGELKEFDADQFFDYSAKQNVANRNSFIKEITLKKPINNSFSQYQKFGLTEIDKGQVNLASKFTWDDNGTITSANIIVSAITKRIERISALEKLIINKKLSPELIKECEDEVEKHLKIVPNYKSSIEFRAQILRTYIKRTLSACMEAQK